jgi:hypothetical protein
MDRAQHNDINLISFGRAVSANPLSKLHPLKECSAANLHSSESKSGRKTKPNARPSLLLLEISFASRQRLRARLKSQ